MASNALPVPLEKLFAKAARMVTGLDALEVTLGIKQNTKAVVSAALAAAEAADSAYDKSKGDRKAANTVVTDKDADGKVFIGNARKRLSKFFGEKPSVDWESAGWPPGSTAEPDSQDDRLTLINKIKAHLAAVPAHASVDMDVTEALALAAWSAINTARANLDTAVTNQGTAKEARDKAAKNLRDRMTGLIGELDTLIEDDDPRWHKFGLNRPADPETPEPPTAMSLLPSLPQTLLADWDDPLRAEHFRVWILIVGTDTDFHAVDSPTDSDATLTGLPIGATVKCRVTSVNQAGESAPGPEAQAVVP